MNLLPRRKCTACGHIKDHVVYDIKVHDFRCQDCRAHHDRAQPWLDWPDLDQEETA